MPTLTKEQISAAMRSYVANIAYCRACREGAARVNLMGHEVGVVTAVEADNAAAGARRGDQGMAEKEEGGCEGSSRKSRS